MNSGAFDPDDQPFRHYSAKHQVVSWVSRHLFDNVTYTVRHGLLKGLRRRGGLGWLPEFVSGGTLSPEEQFWERQKLDGLTVYDVGGFHGLLTMFFARRARQVVCYEPNSFNHARLTENLRLNGITNVEVRKFGVGAQSGEATMVAAPSMMGGATLDPSGAEGLRSTGEGLRSEQITVVALDQDIPAHNLPAPELIKIDIEGFELEALRGARQTLLEHHPKLYLEMHGETMNQKRRNVAAIVAYLEELGYRDILHVESGTKITSANATVAAQGHLYCS